MSQELRRFDAQECDRNALSVRLKNVLIVKYHAGPHLTINSVVTTLQRNKSILINPIKLIIIINNRAIILTRDYVYARETFGANQFTRYNIFVTSTLESR